MPTEPRIIVSHQLSLKGKPLVLGAILQRQILKFKANKDGHHEDQLVLMTHFIQIKDKSNLDQPKDFQNGTKQVLTKKGRNETQLARANT